MIIDNAIKITIQLVWSKHDKNDQQKKFLK